MSAGNQVELSIAPESTFGTIDTGATRTRLRYNSESLAATINDEGQRGNRPTSKHHGRNTADGHVWRGRSNVYVIRQSGYDSGERVVRSVD